MSDSRPKDAHIRRALLQCAYCHKSKLSTSLQRCKACQMVRYCDRPCQKADWPNHKSTCQENVRVREKIAQHAAAGLLEPVPEDDLPLESAQPVLKAWCDAHRPTFSWALMHALDLMADPSRRNVMENVMWVGVRYRPGQTRAAKKFIVERAAKMELGGDVSLEERAKAQLEVLKETLRQRNESAGPDLLGIGAVVVQYKQMVNVLVFGLEKGSEEVILPLGKGQRWEDLLMEMVNEGMKF